MKNLHIAITLGAALALIILFAFIHVTRDDGGTTQDLAIDPTDITFESNTTGNTMQNESTTPSATETSADPNATREVVFKTNKGDITLELFTGAMPITTGNFITLAQNDFYDGIKFHRVISGFMIQAGDPLTKDESQAQRWGQGGPGYTIEDEFVPGLSNVRGTIAMANTGAPNSGGSQFFINLVDNTNLDFDKQPLTSRHPVFGRVVSGMEVVEAIAGVEIDSEDRPLDPVVITDVTF